MSEHRYDIRIMESCVDPNPLMAERQDPDNFPGLQTRERCALEIAAYVFKKPETDRQMKYFTNRMYFSYLQLCHEDGDQKGRSGKLTLQNRSKQARISLLIDRNTPIMSVEQHTSLLFIHLALFMRRDVPKSNAPNGYSYSEKSALFREINFLMKSTSFKLISLISYTAPKWSIQECGSDIGSPGFPACLHACQSFTRPSFEPWLVQTDTSSSQNGPNWSIQRSKWWGVWTTRWLEHLTNILRATVRSSSKTYPSASLLNVCLYIFYYDAIV